MSAQDKMTDLANSLQRLQEMINENKELKNDYNTMSAVEKMAIRGKTRQNQLTQIVEERIKPMVINFIKKVEFYKDAPFFDKEKRERLIGNLLTAVTDFNFGYDDNLNWRCYQGENEDMHKALAFNILDCYNSTKVSVYRDVFEDIKSGKFNVYPDNALNDFGDDEWLDLCNKIVPAYNEYLDDMTTKFLESAIPEMYQYVSDKIAISIKEGFMQAQLKSIVYDTVLSLDAINKYSNEMGKPSEFFTSFLLTMPTDANLNIGVYLYDSKAYKNPALDNLLRVVIDGEGLEFAIDCKDMNNIKILNQDELLKDYFKDKTPIVMNDLDPMNPNSDKHRRLTDLDTFIKNKLDKRYEDRDTLIENIKGSSLNKIFSSIMTTEGTYIEYLNKQIGVWRENIIDALTSKVKDLQEVVNQSNMNLKAKLNVCDKEDTEMER